MSYLPKKYKIISVNQLISDIYLIRIKAKLNYFPGEFIQVSLLGIGEAPFSICSHNKDYIEIVVRNVGDLSSNLCKLKKNDYLFIRGPYGKGYPMHAFKQKNLSLIGGGTGIAPLMSIIDFIEKNRKEFKNIFIYFGFRDKDSILFKEKLKKLQKKFNVFITVDKQEKCSYYTGNVADLLKKMPLNSKQNYALVCGPPIMINSVIEQLKKQSFQSQQIYLSLERRMECGFGRCGRCMIHGKYVCKDGPVFSYNELENLKND